MKSRARPDEKESIVVLMYLAFSLSVSIVNRLCEGESVTISKDRRTFILQWSKNCTSQRSSWQTCWRKLSLKNNEQSCRSYRTAFNKNGLLEKDMQIKKPWAEKNQKVDCSVVLRSQLTPCNHGCATASGLCFPSPERPVETWEHCLYFNWSLVSVHIDFHGYLHLPGIETTT